MTDKGPGFQPIAATRPVRPAVSLLTSARRLVGEWHSGVSWRDPSPLVGYRRAYCNTDTAEDAAEITQPQFYPYTVYVPYACDWVVDDADYRADATAAADAITPWHMARELWTGATESANPSLQSEAASLAGIGTAVHPITALGQLLEAYEDCSQTGGAGADGALIHAPTQAVVALMAHGVVKQVGDVYYGPGGCIVSPGPGYPTDATGTGPSGHADAGSGNVFMYVTGPVRYQHDDVGVPLTDQEAHFDRRRNRYEITAQRMAIAIFDPSCVFATKAYIPSPTQGETP